MRFVRKEFCWKWNINNEKWSRGVRLVAVYVEWLHSELCRINTFTPRLVYCSRFTVTTSYRTVSDQYYGSRSYSVFRWFVPWWNPKVRFHINRGSPSDPAWSQVSLVSTCTPCFYIYIYTYILRGFKTSGDAFRLPHSIAFDCSIRPFWDLFHSWLCISHFSRIFGDDLHIVLARQHF
jgi:hypothetical protein